MSTFQLQLDELIQSGFTREEALQALSLSNNNNNNNNEQNELTNLADYMKQIESDMLQLNKFAKDYNQSIEFKLQTIHNESLHFQQLIQEKEKQLTDKIEHNRNILKSKLMEKKQKYIQLRSKLQEIKDSLDTTDRKQNETDLSLIKQQIDSTSMDTAQCSTFFNMNQWTITDNWHQIKADINASDFDEKTELNETDDILSVDVMTFNIRNSLLDKDWSRLWVDNRRKLTANMLRQCGPPTIIATQEGVINQLIDIQCDLPSNYASVGDGRLHTKWYNSSNDRMNEHCTIFWNNDVLQVIDFGTFQLERPKDAPLPRVVTWSLYEFNQRYNIKYALFVVNTHLSYKTEKIRMVQTKHLMQFVVEIMKNYKTLYPIKLYNKELLILVMGDFNSVNRSGAELYDYLFDDINGIDECMVDGVKIVDYFVDCTKYCALNCSFSYHGFHGMECAHKSNFIDWILCSKNVLNSDAIRLKSIKVITEHEFNEGLPSDHYPVIVTLGIDTTKCQAVAKKDCLLQ